MVSFLSPRLVSLLHAGRIALAMLALAPLTLSACEEEPAFSCTIDGVNYELGESFSPDGCNTCTCVVQGIMTCTLQHCGPPCTYDGQEYEVDESFDANDGCNVCLCAADGVVSCTTNLCESNGDSGEDAPT